MQLCRTNRYYFYNQYCFKDLSFSFNRKISDFDIRFAYVSIDLIDNAIE